MCSRSKAQVMATPEKVLSGVPVCIAKQVWHKLLQGQATGA